MDQQLFDFQLTGSLMFSQHSPRYAVDVEQNIRSMSMATVSGERNVIFTGDVYADIKVNLFIHLFSVNG